MAFLFSLSAFTRNLNSCYKRSELVHSSRKAIIADLNARDIDKNSWSSSFGDDLMKSFQELPYTNSGADRLCVRRQRRLTRKSHNGIPSNRIFCLFQLKQAKANSAVIAEGICTIQLWS
jgi:hypothetical protein